jgi:hypothetical protein
LLHYSCKKEIKEEVKADSKSVTGLQQRSPGGGIAPCRDELEPDGIDTVSTPTVLGYQLVGNPYSVAVMQQASINLYGNNGGIVANKKYVRFKPSNETQLQQLTESGLDLFDYPLDRDVIEEGDYYPQPGIREDEISWLYSVVDIGYLPPSGITYEILQQIYVPERDIWLEDEALRITGNPLNDSCGTVPNLVAPPCDDPCNPGPGCPPPPPECGGGGGGIPPPDIKTPSGFIRVWDSNLGTSLPVKRTRIIARRWFKIDPVYTNDQGKFQCTKRFKNKVNVFVKFLNNNITIHGLRSARLWQMWFPIKKGIGIYSGALNNIDYLFPQNTFQPHSRTNRNWWAAQLMNARIDYDQMATTYGTGQLPSFLRIILTGWANARGAGSTPMNLHRNGPTQYYSPELAQFFVINPITALRTLVYSWLYNGLLLRQTDITFGYDRNWPSDRVNQLFYHEMSHAAHFNKVGVDWWNSLITAETYEIARFGLNGAESPYGIGDDGIISTRIAVAESWAEHMGRMMADNRYPASSSEQFNQGMFYRPDGNINDGGFLIFTGLNPHINLIEDFNPFRTNDPFRWIPYGVYYDLIDNRNDQTVPSPRVLINDEVVGYSNNQFFDALDNDITSLPAFRARLLQENGNNQSTQVINLFAGYGY